MLRKGRSASVNANAEPFQETAGQEKLDQHRDRVDPDIDVREERRARGTVVHWLSGESQPAENKPTSW